MRAFRDLDARLPKVELTARRFLFGYIIPMALIIVGMLWGFDKIGDQQDTLADQQKANHDLVVQVDMQQDALDAQVDRNTELAESNRKATVALCATRVAVRDRIQVTKAILEENPGDTVLGFPRELAEQGLARDKRTLKSLRGLDCPPPPA